MGINSFIAFILIGLAVIGGLELVASPSLALWALMVPFICLSFFVNRAKLPRYLATICTVLVVLDLLLESNSWVGDWQIWGGFATGIATFWGVALIIQQAILSRQALIETQKRLKRSNLELDQFASVAAHDLQSPLKSMRSWTDMLDYLIPAPRSVEIEQALNFIRSNAKKADHLVEDILSISRLNGPVRDPEQVDLNTVVSRLLVLHKNDISDSHARIQTRRLPIVSGNSNYLESLFGNLIQNSIKFKDSSRTPDVWIDFEETPKEFHFSVEDNGIGILPQHQDQVFEMFKRLRSEKQYEGAGIGLAFCKKIVELRGGRIWVDSKPGSGSTFHFTYPKHVSEGEFI